MGTEMGPSSASDSSLDPVASSQVSSIHSVTLLGPALLALCFCGLALIRHGPDGAITRPDAGGPFGRGEGNETCPMGRSSVRAPPSVSNQLEQCQVPATMRGEQGEAGRGGEGSEVGDAPLACAEVGEHAEVHVGAGRLAVGAGLLDDEDPAGLPAASAQRRRIVVAASSSQSWRTAHRR